MDRLFDFAERVDDYDDNRDRPDLFGTSCLSADLHFGTLAPRTVASIVGTSTKGRTAFVRQLAWRDWYAHLLWEVPSLAHTPLRPDLCEWDGRTILTTSKVWQKGLTGYPLIDAGMRQLEAHGWMHNRVRMVVASFLVKDLLVDWRIGERWFRQLLVDGDIAQNAGNWQWVAGRGPDAAPYFRVFNPVLQSRKFDPEGTYIKRFVPELSDLPVRWIHAPWTAPPKDWHLGSDARRHLSFSDDRSHLCPRPGPRRVCRCSPSCAALTTRGIPRPSTARRRADDRGAAENHESRQPGAQAAICRSTYCRMPPWR